MSANQQEVPLIETEPTAGPNKVQLQQMAKNAAQTGNLCAAFRLGKHDHYYSLSWRLCFFLVHISFLGTCLSWICIIPAIIVGKSAKKSEEEGKTELAEKKTKAAYILNVIGIIVACVTPILFVTIIPIIVYFVIINYA